MSIDLVLIKPNDKKNVYGTVTGKYTAIDPPWWLAVMGGYLRDKGISVKLIDAENENADPKETAQKVVSLNPKLVGILLLGSNLTASTWKMNGASILASIIKEESGNELPIFFWGQHVSALPKKTLEEEDADFVIKGEGFDSIYELLINIKNNINQYDEIDGLWYKKDNLIYGNNRMQLIKNLDELPVDGWDLLENNKYRNHTHFAFENLDKRDNYGAIATSLGCPFNCTYCAICQFSANALRFKSPERAVEEVDYWVKNHNVYYLRILDECFTVNKEHVNCFCDLLIERNYNLSIWINARTDLVDEELLNKMYSAGIRWIGYGFESGNKKIRGLVKKDQYTLDQIKHTVEITRKAGIHICSNFMFGLPDDDKDTMKDSLDLARELCCEWPNFYCTMAYPGSKLYDDCIRDGVEMPENWLGYTQLGYECNPLATKYLTSKEVLEFRDYAFNEFFKNNDKYFENIRNKFGEKPIEFIEGLLKNKLKRKLLGD